jgi:dTDP-L-rhamnose 4-epimerase
VDLLLERGWRVRVLDNLERPTHLAGAPKYLDPRAEFIRGDVRNIDDLARSLWGMDAVLHLAATGGFTPDIARYFDTNSIGTANLLELIQQQKFRVRRLVVASSVGIYGEGLYVCPSCGVRPGRPRDAARLERRSWEVACDRCGRDLEPVATPEDKPPSPEKAYSISKYTEERLVLGFGRDFGLAACALRYFLTYGPRQSLTNPYTGVISIFASRIWNAYPPLLFEDGRQTRDFVYVGDVARANVMALEDERFAGRALNVGSGEPTAIADVARLVSELLGRPDLAPDVPGEYRPGESRHIWADVSALRELDWLPEVSLRDGLGRYIEWIRGEGEVSEYFSRAMAGLKRGGVVRSSPREREADAESSLSVVLPVYNEAGNLESIVRYILAELPPLVPDFEVIIVNDGSHDGSGVIADRLAAEEPRLRVVHHPFNVGYGGAQKSGFTAARMAWLVVVPADHQFDVRDLRKFLEHRERADVIGSYRLDRGDTLLRRTISRAYKTVMQQAFHVPLRDVNWIKMFRRSIFERIEIESPGFAVDAEIVVKAKQLGLRMLEVEVPHYERTWGQPTSVSLRNLYRTARELLRIRKMVRRMKAVDDTASASVGRDDDPRRPAPGVAGRSDRAAAGGRRAPATDRSAGR